jgi:hypothetical protein
MTPDKIDLTDLDFFMDGDIDEAFSILRAEGPSPIASVSNSTIQKKRESVAEDPENSAD